MTRFRPCIDLHAGQVKQIVGGTLSDAAPSSLRTNWVSARPAEHYAALYRDADPPLEGAHVIMLGPGNADAAAAACAAWPGHLQVGGGVTDANAAAWVGERRAAKVIVTSFLFPDGRFSQARLDAVLAALGGDRDRLVIDLSCRRVSGDGGTSKWFVAMNKWQTITDMEVNQESISQLAPYCSEFLIHAADNEGLQRGVDEELVAALAEWCQLPGGSDGSGNARTVPVTYAGGGRSLADLELVHRLSHGRVDLTIGSALDCFGGDGVRFDDCVAWNRERQQEIGQ